jgi:hypothetical protein
MERVREFEYANRNLAVRAVALDNEWQIRVYEHDQPITDIYYTIAYETRKDAVMSGLSYCIDRLMDLAQNDIELGIIPVRS